MNSIQIIRSSNQLDQKNKGLQLVYESVSTQDKINNLKQHINIRDFSRKRSSYQSNLNSPQSQENKELTSLFESEKESQNIQEQAIDSGEFDNLCQHTFSVEGIEIKFPKIPYKVQEEYMTLAVKAIKNNKYAALEMPTGTGKTLSLLSSTLAFIDQYNQSNLSTQKQKLKLIYTSRTHSQLSQVRKEIRKSPYQYFKSVTIASRDYYCLRSDLKQEFTGIDLNKQCHKSKQLASNYRCKYFKPNDRIKVEQFVIDEGHNFSQSCQEAQSFILETGEIIRAYTELNDLYAKSVNQAKIKTGHGPEKPENHDFQSVKQLIGIIDKFMKFQTDLKEKHQINIQNSKNTFQGKYVLNISVIDEILTYDQMNSSIKSLKKITNFVMDEGSERSDNQNKDQKKFDTTALDHFLDCMLKLKRTFFSNTFDQVKAYKSIDEFQVSDHYILIQRKHFKDLHLTTDQMIFKEMHLYCFNAAFTFKQIQRKNPFSIILTSGSLSPISTVSYELDVKFDYIMTGGHVIQKNQILPIVYPFCDNGLELSSKYDLPKEHKTIIDENYGKLVRDACLTIEGGILVFFSSYEKMKYSYDLWTKKMYMASILKVKSFYQEQQNKELNNQTIESYLRDMRELDMQSKKNGAVLFGVCRGNFSEGYDFSDYDARCVIIIGMPFACISDPKLLMKWHFLDYRFNQMKENSQKIRDTDSNFISGKTWYEQQTHRAINQAVGRVIRHKNDYGVVILADERYRLSKNQAMLPGWMRKQITVANSSKELRQHYQKFIYDLKKDKIYQSIQQFCYEMRGELIDQEELEHDLQKEVFDDIIQEVGASECESQISGQINDVNAIQSESELDLNSQEDEVEFSGLGKRNVREYDQENELLTQTSIRQQNSTFTNKQGYEEKNVLKSKENQSDQQQSQPQATIEMKNDFKNRFEKNEKINYYISKYAETIKSQDMSKQSKSNSGPIINKYFKQF
eukprot:403358712